MPLEDARFKELQKIYPPKWQSPETGNQSHQLPMDVEYSSDKRRLYNPRRPTPYIRYKSAYYKKNGRAYKRKRKYSSYGGGAQYWRQRYWNRRITGYGDYRTPLGAAGSALGSWAGGHLGGMAGDFVGGMLTGVGDYKVKKNVLMAGNLPTMVNIPHGGGVIVRFQEYITDIQTGIGPNSAFTQQSYQLNPGSTATFPWLSQIAQNFEEYEFEGVVFGFKSTSADALNSTNTALGTVMLATQYDVNDAVFSSKSEMLNYEFSQSIKPSESTMHMIECARSQTPITNLYVLPTGAQIPVNSDPRFYNLGRFTIATQGFQNVTPVNIGELHVTYQVRLMKPKLFTSLQQEIPYLNAQLGQGVGVFTNGLPLGNASVSWIVNGPLSNILTIDQAAQAIIFPPDATPNTWWMMIHWFGTGTATCVAPTVTATNATVAQQQFSNGTLATDFIVWYSFTTQGTLAQSSLVFSGAAVLPTATQSIKIRLTQVNPFAI